MRSGLRCFAMAVLVSATALIGAGCSSGGGSMSSSAAPITADRGTVVLQSVHGQLAFYTPSTNGTPLVYAQPGYGKCEQCEADVKAYYMTGMIDPVCKVCGAKRIIVYPGYGHGMGHQ